MPLPVEEEKELSVGGFQGIKKIYGLITNIDVVSPPETWENQDKDVVKVDMEDAKVVEMFGDEDPFELKDGKFGFYIPYAEKGKKPHQNSIYNKCWLESAKEQGFKPSDKIGQYVTLERQARLLFETYEMVEDPETKKKKPKVNEAGEKVKKPIYAVNQTGLPNHFCFAKEGGAEKEEDIKGYIVDLVVGRNPKAALRELTVQVKAKRFPEYKDMLKNNETGKFCEALGVKLVDGKFAKEG